MSDSDPSPPRRSAGSNIDRKNIDNVNDSNVSPPPRRPTSSKYVDNGNDGDVSPPRRPTSSKYADNGNDGDVSPPRRPTSSKYIDKGNDGDVSPPRRPASSKHEKRTDRGHDRDSSPPRKPASRADDRSPQRREHRDKQPAPRDSRSPPRKPPSDRRRDSRSPIRKDSRDRPSKSSNQPPSRPEPSAKRTKLDEYDDRFKSKPTDKPSHKPSEDSSRYQWGNTANEVIIEDNKADNEIDEENQIKADFGLSGALAKDERTGNTKNGIILQYSEALDAADPKQKYRLYVFKGDENIDILHIHKKSSYLIGRDERIADIIVAHPSCSKQHAVIQYRMIRSKDPTGGGYTESVRPYLIDLNAPNRTKLNGVEIEEARYYELLHGDCITFGGSTRDYVLMSEGEAEAATTGGGKRR